MAPQHYNEQTLAAVLPDGIVILDANNCIEWWNKAAQRLLSLSSEHKGQLIDACISHKSLKNYLKKKILQQPTEFPAPNDPSMRLSVTIVSYGKERKVLIIRDVTHTYHLEIMRQDFVADVSHELRTPLTVLRGYLELLLDSLPPALITWQKNLIQMQQQSLRMERVVEDLLLLSRLEIDLPTKQEQEKMNIPLLLDMIRKDAIALSGNRHHQITLEVTGPKWFHGKKAELQSAFSNLVFNAVHYTPENGHIAMRWYNDRKGTHFEVKDTGIGIEAKHISRLTERFYRVDPGRTRQTGGTGLGLAIVKHVLIRHHGQLHIESKIGKGSIFRCDFYK